VFINGRTEPHDVHVRHHALREAVRLELLASAFAKNGHLSRRQVRRRWRVRPDDAAVVASMVIDDGALADIFEVTHGAAAVLTGTGFHLVDTH